MPENERGTLVPKYTAEDYLSGDGKPFAEVYALRSDSFAEMRAVEIMSNAAMAVGVRGFKSLYKEYKKSKLKNFEGNYEPNATNFSKQMLELNIGDWEADDFGVRKGAGAFEEIACPHPIMMTARVVNIDTGLEKVHVAFSRGGKKWRTLIVPRNQIANPREIVKLADAGIAVNSRTAPSLSDFFMDMETLNYDIIPEVKSVTRLGWIDDEGFSPFVDGLIFDGEAAYKPIFESIRPHGKFSDWFAAARNFRAESVTARIVMAASFASVLVKPLGALPFFVHLWGIDSSTGKTVALLAAASVWGNPEMGKYVKTFDGTDVGYERTAEFLNSLPMCIDELQLAKNRSGQVVFSPYKLAQGAGRSRGNKSGGVDRTPTWSNAILTTGETPLTSLGSGAGAVNRVIELECTAESKVVKDGRTVLQAFKKSYGHAGKLFVEKLQQDGAIERAEKIYNDAFLKLNSSETTDKQAIAAAILVAADVLATEWIFKDDNAITAEEIAKFLASRASVSTGARGYSYMCDWVAQNTNKLKETVDVGEVFGLIDDDWVYIIGNVFNNALEDAGFNAKAVLSFMGEKGLIRKSRNGKSTFSKRILGTPVKCVCMRLNCDCDEPFEETELL